MNYLIIIFKIVSVVKAISSFLKRNLEANLESSQSNINIDEIPGTSGQKKRKQ